MRDRAAVRATADAFGAGTRPAQSPGGVIGRGADPGVHAEGVGGTGWPPSEVRVRFAPSPSGSLHIGNARTALFNWLFARKHGGRLILRIDDTDRERSKPELEAAILEDLRWLGLHWDEGPDVGGSAGPYRQSERLPAYRAAVDRLLAEGKAYPCFCSPEALEGQRRERLARGLPPRYDGRCRALSSEEVARRRGAGEAAAIRFAMPQERIHVRDLVKGDVLFLGSDLDDFVVLRADGTPSYNFAAAVDDCRMAVTLVIRGDDHLANTPRQMALARALGWEPPAFAHLPLIHGGDRVPLSKRHGAVTVAEHRAAGVVSEALANYLALLGWSPPAGVEEVLDLQALGRHFALDRVSRSPARFDAERLVWFNRQHLRRSPLDRLLSSLPGYLLAEDPAMGRRAIEALRRDAPTLKAVEAGVATVLREPTLLVFTASHVQAVREASRAVRGSRLTSEAEAHDLLDRLGRDLGVTRRDLMHALRMALVGSMQGLPVATLLWVLGPEESARRLDRALSLAAVGAARGR